MVYDIPFNESMKITGLIDGKTATIEEAYQLSPELKAMRNKTIKDNRKESIRLSEVFDMAERFEGLRHHTVIRRDDEDDNVGDVGAASAHRAEGRMTRCIQKRDLLQLVFAFRMRKRNGVSADMLGDATGFA